MRVARGLIRPTVGPFRIEAGMPGTVLGCTEKGAQSEDKPDLASKLSRDYILLGSLVLKSLDMPLRCSPGRTHQMPV